MLAPVSFNRLIEHAPAPALYVGQDGEGWAWAANAAARRQIADDDVLVELAKQVMRDADAVVAPTPAGARGGPVRVGSALWSWTLVPCETGWLAWLFGPAVDTAPDAVATDDAPAAAPRTRPASDSQASMRARLLRVADTAGVGHWAHDVQAGRVRWDETSSRLHGVKPTDADRSVEDALTGVHPDDRDGVLAHLRADPGPGATEPAADIEFRIRRPDGRERWLHSHAAFVERAGQTWVMGAQWDVTDGRERRRLERERDEARSASLAKTEFLGRMSHEMRTPLNAVIGFARLLHDEPDNTLTPPQRRRLQHIQQAGEHLLGLIDDTRDLSSIEAGTLSCRPEPVELEPIVAECLQWVAHVAERAEVRIVRSDVRGTVVADPRRLRQVLINLLSNAIKYNHRGGWVEVRVATSADGAQFGLEVRDNGVGMGEEQRARLFRPYDRLGAENTTIDGTGLGLAITHHLIDRMGGRLEARSHADVGSSFCVWLPAVKPAAAPADAVPPTAPAPAAPSADRVLHLLCIDDDPVNGLLIEKVVSMRRGVRLHLARDGASGLAMARSLRPQVVLLDLKLPDCSGFEVYDGLRAIPGMEDSQVIMLSASVAAEDKLRARQVGFADYWTKPIQVTQFLTRLDILTDQFAAELD